MINNISMCVFSIKNNVSNLCVYVLLFAKFSNFIPSFQLFLHMIFSIIHFSLCFCNAYFSFTLCVSFVLDLNILNFPN